MLWPETTQRGGDGRLTIGDVALDDLAARFGTPLYVYDEATLRGRARRIRRAFARAYPRSRVVYAGKAGLSPALVAILWQEGLGLDVVSGGELHAGLAAGVPAPAMTFHGNNKSETELREALAAGVGLIAADNQLELATLARLATELSTGVPLLLRLNPGVAVHTHGKIATGIIDSKFGFPLWTEDAAEAVRRVVETPGLDLMGYHAHLGSQLFDVAAGWLVIDALFDFAAAMRDRHGIEPSVISPGGGFGIAYEDGAPEAAFEEWAAVMGAATAAASARHRLALPELVVEPGRAIVGPAGVAIYRVGAIEGDPTGASLRVDRRRHGGQYPPVALRGALHGGPRQPPRGRCARAGHDCRQVLRIGRRADRRHRPAASRKRRSPRRPGRRCLLPGAGEQLQSCAAARRGAGQ